MIGTSVAYHLVRAGLGRRAAAGAGHALRAVRRGTRPGWSARCARPRAAPGWCSTPPSSTPGSRRRPGWPPATSNVGGVIVARTEDRMVQLRRTAANAIAYDMECALLTPDEALEKWPVMAVDDLLGALWLPGDGKVNPTDLTMALAKGARQRRRPDRGEGAGDRRRRRRTGRPGRRVTGVRTDRGDVEAEVVVNCAGQWAKALADAGRRDRAAALGRALLRRDRRDRGRAPGPADHARPRRLHLLQGGGRRPGRRRLRARGQAVAVARRRSRTRSSSSCSRRTGTTSRC